MPPWLLYIISAQRKESSVRSSNWIQLATVGIDNTPRVRTVVFRGWSKSYEMELLTDKRSHKYQELSINNNVEICWLFTKSNSQFRLRGRSRFDYGKDKIRYWNQLSEYSKSMWSWPSPGEKFKHDSKNDNSPHQNEVISNNFLLLKIDIDHVDHLILNKSIHIRKRWILKDDWTEERINP